jgi:hypothetical protein
MKRKAALALLLLAAFFLSVMVGSPAGAQTSINYNLEWHVIGGGGQPVSSASYAVNSTAGQAAASPPISTSASYVVSGGYWFSPPYGVYLPVVLRSY